MADQKDTAHAWLVLEEGEPLRCIIDIGGETQITLGRRGGLARCYAALVDPQRGDPGIRQTMREKQQAVVDCAGKVAIAIGRTGARKDERSVELTDARR